MKQITMVSTILCICMMSNGLLAMGKKEYLQESIKIIINKDGIHQLAHQPITRLQHGKECSPDLEMKGLLLSQRHVRILYALSLSPYRQAFFCPILRKLVLSR